MTTPRTPEQLADLLREVAIWVDETDDDDTYASWVREAADLLSTLSATVEVLRQEIKEKDFTRVDRDTQAVTDRIYRVQQMGDK